MKKVGIFTETQCRKWQLTSSNFMFIGVFIQNCIFCFVLRNRLLWYGHVLRKEDNDWVKKCMEYEVLGSRPRCRPKEDMVRSCAERLPSTWIVRGRWMKLIRMVDEQEGCEWINVSSGTSSPRQIRTKGCKMVVCVCVCYEMPVLYSC